MKWVAAVITAIVAFVAMWILTAVAWFGGTLATILALAGGPALIGFGAGALTSGRAALVAGLMGLVAGIVYLFAPYLEYILVYGGLAVASYAIAAALGRRRVGRRRAKSLEPGQGGVEAP